MSFSLGQTVCHLQNATTVDLADVEKSVANAILTQALFTPNMLLKALVSLGLLQGAKSLCFCFSYLNCLHTHELLYWMSPFFFFILFVLTVRQPDRKHRSPTRPPSHNKLEVTQLLLHRHQESNACAQHKYIEEWSVSWHGTYPNPDYPV